MGVRFHQNRWMCADMRWISVDDHWMLDLSQTMDDFRGSGRDDIYPMGFVAQFDGETHCIFCGVRDGFAAGNGPAPHSLAEGFHKGVLE